MLSLWCLLLLIEKSTSAVVYYGQFGDPFLANRNGVMVHAYNDGKSPILTNKKDGAHIFKLHKPPVSSVRSSRALSIESVKFPGYFLYATPDNELKLKIPKTKDEKLASTFHEHLKVRTDYFIYSLEGRQYDFICNKEDPPYQMVIRTDDDTRFFADRCSYRFVKLTEDQADEIMKQQTGLDIRQQPGFGDGDDIGIFGDPAGSSMAIHASGIGKQLSFSSIKDGGEIFKLHRPPILGKTESPVKAVNIESAKYPGYFLIATKDLKKVILEKPTDSDSMQRAMFRQNFKVRTKSSIFLLEGHEYEFLCNTKAPYMMVIRTDDNTRFFADRCSYTFRKLSKGEAKKRISGSNPTSQLPGQADPVDPNGIPNGGGNGSYIKLYIPGSPGNKPILGLKASRLEKVRIGLPPDQFIVKSPGFNGIEGTYSFESVKHPEFYLQRIGRDIYLKAKQKNPDFYSSATFKITRIINKKHRYFINPYAQPEWFLGHIHEPPFYVRAMYNNNTAEFDLDASWVLKFDTKREEDTMKWLSHANDPLTINQEIAIIQGLQLNPSRIIELLMTKHKELLLAQLATINGLQGMKPAAFNQAVMSDAAAEVNLNAGSSAGSISGSNTVGTSGGIGTTSGTSAVTDNAKQAATGPAVEVVVEKYEPWSDWSACSAQCGTGHQIRVRPCKVTAQGCTPLQQSQPCVASAPCQPVAPAVTSQASQPVIQAGQGAAVIQGQPVQSTACPFTCSFDCNPTSCPLKCCSNLVKKAHIAGEAKSKRKSSFKISRKNEKRNH